MADVDILDAGGGTKTVRTFTISGKEYQAMIDCDPLGNSFEADPYRNLDLGNSGVSVKGAAGYIRYGICENRANDGTEIHLKLYDKATAASASDTPVHTFTIQAGQQFILPFTGYGLKFTLGISVRATTGLADASTTSPASNNCVLNLGYK